MDSSHRYTGPRWRSGRAMSTLQEVASLVMLRSSIQCRRRYNPGAAALAAEGHSRIFVWMFEVTSFEVFAARELIAQGDKVAVKVFGRASRHGQGVA